VDFASKLKSARELKRVSVDDLAAQLGVSRQTIYDWESGKSEPRKTKLEKLKLILSMDHSHHTDYFELKKDDVRVIPVDVWEELQKNNNIFKVEIDRLWNLIGRLDLPGDAIKRIPSNNG
jgi:predicted transcriptional regulator